MNRAKANPVTPGLDPGVHSTTVSTRSNASGMDGGVRAPP